MGAQNFILLLSTSNVLNMKTISSERGQINDKLKKV